jgi:hypothetical protein
VEAGQLREVEEVDLIALVAVSVEIERERDRDYALLALRIHHPTRV